MKKLNGTATELIITIGLIWLFLWCFIYSNKSECIIKVDGETVFNGLCRHSELTSIGENGNTKQLTISKFSGGIVGITKVYVSDDIKTTIKH